MEVKIMLPNSKIEPKAGNGYRAISSDELKANAQLIAAAPALLEVCRTMATEIDRFCAKNNIGGGFGVTHKAWAVIAAAEGK
jgi:hypothetical protein